MGEAQSGAKDPGSERGVSFRSDSSVGVCGRVVSTGTSFNGPGPALSRLTRWAFICPPFPVKSPTTGTRKALCPGAPWRFGSQL